MHNELKHLGYIIKDSRERKDLTQRELSLKADVSLRTIIDVENGHRNITVNLLFRLIRVLQISANDIFYPDETTHTPEQNQFFIAFFDATPVQQKNIIEIAEIIMRDH